MSSVQPDYVVGRQLRRVDVKVLGGVSAVGVGKPSAVQQSLNRINNCVDFKQAQEKNLQARLAREQ